MLDESCMIGKRIKHIEVGGFGVLIILEDGTIFDYKSSGEGNSCWDIIKEPNYEAKPIGKWIQNDNGTYSCSLCQSWIPKEQYYYARFCLYCGAKMENE